MSRESSKHDTVTRRPAVTEAVPSPHLSGLDLNSLRAYRHALTAEEDKVSYWRRLVHARIDLLEAEASSDAALSFDDLVRVLGDTGTGHTWEALIEIRPSDPLPELPVLADMWATEVDPHDPESVADALGRLWAAERKLTKYRHALHERVNEATAELIVRYRRDPASALAVLPRD